MDHMQPLMVKTNASDTETCGHALMATCPPQQHIDTNPDEPYPYQVQDVPMPDLIKLLELSNRLPLDGEITPIMAWASIRGHKRAGELSASDYRAIKDGLAGKVRCYGYAFSLFIFFWCRKRSDGRFMLTLFFSRIGSERFSKNSNFGMR